MSCTTGWLEVLISSIRVAPERSNDGASPTQKGEPSLKKDVRCVSLAQMELKAVIVGLVGLCGVVATLHRVHDLRVVRNLVACYRSPQNRACYPPIVLNWTRASQMDPLRLWRLPRLQYFHSVAVALTAVAYNSPLPLYLKHTEHSFCIVQLRLETLLPAPTSSLRDPDQWQAAREALALSKSASPFVGLQLDVTVPEWALTFYANPNCSPCSFLTFFTFLGSTKPCTRRPMTETSAILLFVYATIRNDHPTQHPADIAPP